MVNVCFNNTHHATQVQLVGFHMITASCLVDWRKEFEYTWYVCFHYEGLQNLGVTLSYRFKWNRSSGSSSKRWPCFSHIRVISPQKSHSVPLCLVSRWTVLHLFPIRPILENFSWHLCFNLTPLICTFYQVVPKQNKNKNSGSMKNFCDLLRIWMIIPVFLIKSLYYRKIWVFTRFLWNVQFFLKS